MRHNQPRLANVSSSLTIFYLNASSNYKTHTLLDSERGENLEEHNVIIWLEKKLKNYQRLFISLYLYSYNFSESDIIVLRTESISQTVISIDIKSWILATWYPISRGIREGADLFESIGRNPITEVDHDFQATVINFPRQPLICMFSKFSLQSSMLNWFLNIVSIYHYLLR